MAILDDEAFLNEAPPEVVETVAEVVEAPVKRGRKPAVVEVAAPAKVLRKKAVVTEAPVKKKSRKDDSGFGDFG